MTEPTIIGLLISALFTENFVLVKFLGCCPFLGVSKKIDTAIGMGMAVTFVMAIASMFTYLANRFLLVPLNLEYLQTILFILIIAALVQFVEMVIKKTMPVTANMAVITPKKKEDAVRALYTPRAIAKTPAPTPQIIFFLDFFIRS